MFFVASDCYVHAKCQDLRCGFAHPHFVGAALPLGPHVFNFGVFAVAPADVREQRDIRDRVRWHAIEKVSACLMHVARTDQAASTRRSHGPSTIIAHRTLGRKSRSPAVLVQRVLDPGPDPGRADS